MTLQEITNDSLAVVTIISCIGTSALIITLVLRIIYDALFGDD